LAPLVDPKKGDKLEIDTSSDDECDIFVELKYTFIKELSFEEPYIVEMHEIIPPRDLLDPFHVKCSLDFAPTLLIAPFFFSLSFALLWSILTPL